MARDPSLAPLAPRLSASVPAKGRTGGRAPNGASVTPTIAPDVRISRERTTRGPAAIGRSLSEVAREAGVEDAILDEALDFQAMAKPHG